jgi:hypothetical protein
MKEYFTWKADRCFTRSGAELKPGKVYAAADFSAEIVEEWIKSGAAEPAKKSQKE